MAKWYLPNVDDSARVAMLIFSGFLQEWQESSRHEVDLGDIGTVRGFPFLERSILWIEQVLPELLSRLTGGQLVAAGNAGIVDQDAETLLPRLNLLYEFLDLLLLGDVGSDGDDFARNVFAVSFDDSLELVFGSADDVNLGSVPKRECDVSLRALVLV
jgi:hypothetical protein